MKVQIPFSWPALKVDATWSLFLDRDGVINERLPGDYVKCWEEFKFLPGVPESTGILSEVFGRIFVVTNQAGIEKGLLTHEALEHIHEQMMDVLMYHGGRVDEIYYCPFTQDLDPLCRKPNPGMALEAKRDFPDIDFNRCIMVGDSDSDIIFGNNLGMRTILVGDKSDNNFTRPGSLPDWRLGSLADVALSFKGV